MRGRSSKNVSYGSRDAANKSLDASGGRVFRNLIGSAQGALNRAAASTPTFDGFRRSLDSHLEGVGMTYRKLFSIIPLVLISFFAARPVVGAGPRILIIHGALLKRQVILSDWYENQQLMNAVSEAIDVTDSDLRGRPYVKLAFFWGPAWVRYVEEGKNPARLKLSQANQLGRYYPAFGKAEAVWKFEYIPGPGSLTRRVDATGIRILQSHGIPVKLSPKPPNNGLQRTRR